MTIEILFPVGLTVRDGKRVHQIIDSLTTTNDLGHLVELVYVARTWLVGEIGTMPPVYNNDISQTLIKNAIGPYLFERFVINKEYVQNRPDYVKYANECIQAKIIPHRYMEWIELRNLGVLK